MGHPENKHGEGEKVKTGLLAVDLSICVVTLEAQEYVRKCLASLFRHSGGLELEVFVVDNGSTDGTPDRVEREFPKARLIRNQRNVGFAKANNQALALSKGKYVMLLNPDAEVRPKTLPTLISFMEGHPEVGMVGPKMLNPDGSLQPSCHQRFPTLLDFALEAFGIGPLTLWLYKRAFFKHFFLARLYAGHDQEGEIAWAGGACLLARRSAIEQVGGLDERYFLYREDTDWCFEFLHHGWKVYYLPQAEIIHHWGKTSERWSTLSIVAATQSNLLFFSKRAPRGLLWLVPCLVFIGISVRSFWTGVGYLFFKSRREVFGVRLKGYRMALGMMFKKRFPTGEGVH